MAKTWIRCRRRTFKYRNTVAGFEKIPQATLSWTRFKIDVEDHRYLAIYDKGPESITIAPVR